MVAPRKIDKETAENDQWAIWNAAVDMLAMEDLDLFSSIQTTASLVFWYQAETMNGGHLQFFENRGSAEVPATIDALKKMSVPQIGDILQEAIRLWESKERPPLETVDDFVAEALEEEFADLDRRFYEADTDLQNALENYVLANRDEFVEID